MQRRLSILLQFGKQLLGASTLSHAKIGQFICTFQRIKVLYTGSEKEVNIPLYKIPSSYIYTSFQVTLSVAFTAVTEA